MDAKTIVDQIIELDLQIAQLRDQFDELPVADRSTRLRELYESNCRDTGPESSVPLSLVRATDLVFGLEDSAAPILAPALEHANPDVRHLAGEALIGLAEEGVAHIVPAVDQVLEAGGRGAEEMPFILALIDDGEAPRQIERFLAVSQADPVVAAIEALADVGDPTSVDALRKLTGDKRAVPIDGGTDAGEITIGELAGEAIEMIELDREEQQ